MLDAEISDLPPFLRIECVKVDTDFLDDEDEDEGKEFQEFITLFDQLKSALVGSHLILGCITVAHIEIVKEKLLPFFDCCKSYKFMIKMVPKEISKFIVSLLQMPSIESSVDIEFYGYHRSSDQPTPDNATSLPIEAISNWLHKPAVESVEKIGEKRFLRINLSNINNMPEMVGHLVKVNSLKFYFN